MLAARPSALRGADRGPLRARRGVLGMARTMARYLTLERQLDFWLRELDPVWSPTAARARVIDVVDETHDVRTFVLAPNAHWPGHRPGQFVTVEVEVDGVRMQRCYSLSSAPDERHVAITVKRVPGGRVSTWMHDRVLPGQVLGLGMPSGDFLLATASPKVLLVSGGSGVTPCMSILRDLARRDAVEDVVFVHAARARRDVIFARELDALGSQHPGLRVVLFLDSERPLGGGVLDRETLRTVVPDLAERRAMLCGPAGMMEALAPVWTESGLGHRLKVERFVPPAAAPPAAAPRVKVALVTSGRTIVTERAGSLLEQLERAGERPASGCRMGICNTCVCRKRSGVVEDLVTGAISSDADQDIRLCVSRARSDVELAL